jgi:perosamine synthetase
MSDIPLFEIPWDEKDISNVVESVSRGSHWAKGPFVDEFEAKLSEYFGVEHALVVNSGTTALECALRAHGIGEGDEVLVPSFTFIATANVVELVGAKPVFVDVELKTFGMDPEDARAKVTNDTAMILPIHCYGSPCLIEDLVEVAKDEGIPIVEDAAEAFGATADGEKVGKFGDAAALSFCQNKILPTGEGGAILTENGSVAAKIKSFRSHGRQIDDNYFDSVETGQYTTIGTNYRMPDIVAALGCSQFEKVEQFIEGRREAANYYQELFGEIPGIEPFSGRDEGNDKNVYQLYTIVLDNEDMREKIVVELSERDIGCKVYWDPPVHQTETHRGTATDKLRTTNHISSRVLSLPMYPGIEQNDIFEVVQGIKAAIE